MKIINFFLGFIAVLLCINLFAQQEQNSTQNAYTITYDTSVPLSSKILTKNSNESTALFTDLTTFEISVASKDFTAEQYQAAKDGTGDCMNTYMGLTTDGRFIVNQKLLNIMVPTRALYVTQHPEKFVVVQ